MSKKILNSLKLLTFDATGTLVQFRQPPVQVYMEFASKYGIQTEEDKMKASFRKQWKELNSSQPHFGISWKAWWTQFVIGTYKDAGVNNVHESTLNKIATELIDHFRTSDCWELKPGAIDLVSKLAKLKRVQVGVISNFDPRLREILKAVGISKLLEFCVLSHEEQISKPSKEIFLKAVEMATTIQHSNLKVVTDFSTQECFHFGDNYELDYIGATSCGWKAGLLVAPHNINDIPKDLPKNVVFTSLPEFRDYLFS